MQTTDTSHLFRTETALAVEEARKKKYERTKSLGSPIDMLGKPLDIIVRGNSLWAAESAAVIRKLDLESGSVQQMYKGHKGPVTCICLLDLLGGSPLLASGSWDKSIKIWNTSTEISSTPAHADFVKCMVIVPGMNLLVSGGSDKCIRFWDISNPTSASVLPSLGYLSEHDRPVQCVAIDASSVGAMSCTLYSADTMGVIKIWNIERLNIGGRSSCRGTLLEELSGHRTGVNDMWLGGGTLWTASTDETVRIEETSSWSHPPVAKTTHPIILQHPKPVKAVLPLSFALSTISEGRLSPGALADIMDAAEPYLLTAFGDRIRAYDLSSGDIQNPDVIGEVDGHSHDVTALRVWLRDVGDSRHEIWIVSASLDDTVRKWNLSEFTTPHTEEGSKLKEIVRSRPNPTKPAIQMTEEEERELAELLDSD